MYYHKKIRIITLFSCAILITTLLQASSFHDEETDSYLFSSQRINELRGQSVKNYQEYDIILTVGFMKDLSTYLVSSKFLKDMEGFYQSNNIKEYKMVAQNLYDLHFSDEKKAFKISLAIFDTIFEKEQQEELSSLSENLSENLKNLIINVVKENINEACGLALLLESRYGVND